MWNKAKSRENDALLWGDEVPQAHSLAPHKFD
ncbi:Bgt-887 [Blumeria graminis f. sp. tritici]|uniref:Bgt-887 n=2 Tax=Blumeria graminis f. sp. tritici TaxID=62690 RepID=A0A9X9PSB3_BLUGR|nr:Bgt-887 [Blumeria graminis f. sp. tritici]